MIQPLIALEYQARCAGEHLWDTPQALLLWADADSHYDPQALMQAEIQEAMKTLEGTALRLRVEHHPESIILSAPATRLMSAESMRRSLVGLDLLNSSYQRIAITALQRARTVKENDCISMPESELTGVTEQIVKRS